MKKRFLWSIVIVISLLVMGFFAPGIYWNVAGRIRGEAFYAGRPTSFWRARMKADEERQNNARHRFVVGGPIIGGAGPALADGVGGGRVGVGGGAAPLTWRDHFESWREKWLGAVDRQLVDLDSDADAIPVWRGLLGDEDPTICGRAFTAILKHGQAADLPKLVDFVMNDDGSLRMALSGGARVAVFAIHKRFGNETGPLYYPWLRHHEPKRANLACVGVALCGEASAPAIPLLLPRLDTADGKDAADALAAIGPKSLPALVAVLRKDNDETRRHATKAIARMLQGTQARLPHLRHQLKDVDAVVRTNAISGLGTIAMGRHEPVILADLIGMLSDSETSVRAAAIDWLVKVRARDAVPALQKIVDSGSTIEIRAQAEKAIRQITMNDDK